MGFRLWYEGILFMVSFGLIVGLPCFFVAVLGSKMINDLGYFPTKAAKIQLNMSWKIFMVEVVAFLMLIVFFHIFS
ncbi:MAG: hypothetical protein HY209_05370 [Candidatus Omnitrophica bacterium]|nr:hypothetical protein [Candidatus Omnitrophota bacterium]